MQCKKKNAEIEINASWSIIKISIQRYAGEKCVLFVPPLASLSILVIFLFIAIPLKQLNNNL